MNRILLGRVGWMKFYAGSQSGDERPVGGGQFNLEDVGSELDNFKDDKGFLYGYVRASGGGTGANLRRIDPHALGDALGDCTLVFVAKHKTVGQVMIGWYRDATLYACERYRNGRPYLAKTPTTRAVLLPTERRQFNIPMGASGMGRANMFYVFDDNGKRRNRPWLRKLFDFIREYGGPNLLENPLAEEEGAFWQSHERMVVQQSGQGIIPDAEVRGEIERRAMEAARKHYTKLGYHVDDVHAKESYDLRCAKGKRLLFVEVKGTQGLGQTILLTPGEVDWAKRHVGRTALFVLHSIRVQRKGRAFSVRGGKKRVYDPWTLDKERLRPLSFQYRTPGRI